jgi:hypothetical protein
MGFAQTRAVGRLARWLQQHPEYEGEWSIERAPDDGSHVIQYIPETTASGFPLTFVQLKMVRRQWVATYAGRDLRVPVQVVIGPKNLDPFKLMMLTEAMRPNRRS